MLNKSWPNQIENTFAIANVMRRANKKWDEAIRYLI